MSFNVGQLHTHIEDGGSYRLIDPAALMKHPDTGEWLAAVIYEDADINSPRRWLRYATTEERWTTKFRASSQTPAPRVGAISDQSLPATDDPSPLPTPDTTAAGLVEGEGS